MYPLWSGQAATLAAGHGRVPVLFPRAPPQVLAELPGQLLGYMGTHNTAPAAWKGTPYQLPNGHWYGEHKPAVVKKRR